MSSLSLEKRLIREKGKSGKPERREGSSRILTPAPTLLLKLGDPEKMVQGTYTGEVGVKGVEPSSVRLLTFPKLQFLLSLLPLLILVDEFCGTDYWGPTYTRP